MKDNKLYLYKEGKEPGSTVDVDEFVRFQGIIGSQKNSSHKGSIMKNSHNTINSGQYSTPKPTVNNKFANGNHNQGGASPPPNNRVQLPQIRLAKEDSADQAVRKAVKSNLETAQNRMQLILSKYDQVEVDAKLKLDELEGEITKIKEIEKEE